MATTRISATVRFVRRYLVVPLVLLAMSAALLPLIETDIWWIRYLDFMRLQVAIALVGLIAVYAMLGGARGGMGALVMLLALGGLVYQGYRLYPYAPVVSPMALQVSCPDEDSLSVLVANVQASNRQGDAFLKIVRDADPDVLVVMETNAWWNEQLASLGGYPHRHQYIPDGPAYYGMHLMSRLTLSDTRTEFFFDSHTPTMRATVELPGGKRVALFGLHPRPPHQWSQPSTSRDGHLARVGLIARDEDEPVVVAGDFNATPWERATRLAMRLGGLLDPRVGRGLVPTYGARSWWMSWPLDQVLFQAGIGLQSFERLPSFGSDHYPVLARLCVEPSLRERQHAPDLREDDMEDAREAINAAQALHPDKK